MVGGGVTTGGFDELDELEEDELEADELEADELDDPAPVGGPLEEDEEAALDCWLCDDAEEDAPPPPG